MKKYAGPIPTLLMLLSVMLYAESRTATGQVPDADIRMAIDTNLAASIIGQFDRLKYGHWIRLQQYGCGDRTEFYVSLNKPELAITPWRDGNGLPGAEFRAHSYVVGDVRGCHNPVFEAQVWASTLVGGITPVGSPPSIGIPISGKGEWTLKLGSVKVDGSFPLNQTAPVAISMANIPVTIVDPPGGKAEFGSGTVGHWTAAKEPKSRAIPVSYRISSWGAPAVLSLDATIGAERVLKFSTAEAAEKYFQSDKPIWGNGNFGITIRDGVFGSASAVKPGTGVLGALLPVKIDIPLTGKILSVFPYDTKLQVVFDGAKITPIKHDGGDAYEANLTASSARIGDTDVIAKDGIVTEVVGKVIFDRIGVEGTKIRFRVADFRVEVSTSKFLLPVKLSSGGLEKSLNGGAFDLGDIKPYPVSLPACVPAGDKFISQPNVCESNPNGVIGWLGHADGKRTITLTPDTSSAAIRRNAFEIEGKGWSGIQTTINVAPK